MLYTECGWSKRSTGLGDGGKQTFAIEGRGRELKDTSGTGR